VAQALFASRLQRVACAGLQAQLNRKRHALRQVTINVMFASIGCTNCNIPAVCHDVALFSRGARRRNDDMWLLSIVHMEGVGTSRKWVNWRDLYYPGGFIKWPHPPKL
jgi:hypothetical protein